MILTMGPPLFVPTGRRLSKWRIGGWGRTGDSDAPTMAEVSAQNFRLRRTLSIETIVVSEPRDWVMILRVLTASVHADVVLPFSVTVTEEECVIQVGRGDMTLRRFVAGEAWIGVGSAAGREVRVLACGVRCDEIALAQVDDLTALPESRWC
jgi:hypothetical protein